MHTRKLHDRMKNYEKVSEHFLIERMPVIIRIDGKSFSRYTKGMGKPYDFIVARAMEAAARVLCETVQGCRIAYIQSDEISLLVTSYSNRNAEPWFKNSLTKIESITASIATMAFNRAFTDIVNETDGGGDRVEVYKKNMGYAIFDSRAFNLPEREVVNYFIWRQRDAINNSIQSLGQLYFSHQQLFLRTVDEIKEMLLHHRGIDWNRCPIEQQRGKCIVRETVTQEINEITFIRDKWITKKEIPIFTEDREYIEELI